jgi:O-antigen ligase
MGSLNAEMQKAVVSRLQAWLVLGSHRRQVVATLGLCLVVGVALGALFAFLGSMLAIGALFAVAGGLILLRSTRWILFALISLICLLPFAALPVPDIGFSPTLLDLVLLVLLFSWLFQVARRKRRRFVGSSLGLPVLIFMALACVSFVIGLSFASLSTNLLRHFAELLLSIFLFFLVLNTVQDVKDLQQVITVLILAGLAAALIGIVLYFLPQDLTIRLLSMLRIFRYPAGSGVLRYVEENPDLPLRATSTSIDPNVLGGLLVIIAGVTAPQLLARHPLPLFQRRRNTSAHGRGINWLVVPVLAVLLVCLLLTFSRGAMGGLAIGLSALALLRYRKLLVVMLVVALVVLLLPQTQWYIQHFLEGLRGQDLATQMRFGEYKDALILISRYPWLGVGFGGAPDIDTYIGVSNVYLLIAEEMGFLGLVVFLCIAALAIRQALRWLDQERDSQQEAIVLGLLTALLGALSSGLVDHYFFNINFQHAVALFWLCTGLLVSTTQSRRPAVEAQSRHLVGEAQQPRTAARAD